jgi:trehalose 6-phosphate phosphatase
LSTATDPLPPFARAALLLDLDGTLLDFAATPMEVIVPAMLPPTLLRLRDELDGALAVITGRPVEQIDTLLPGIVPVVAGEHGGALRPAPGAALQRPDLPAVPPEMLEQAGALAAAHPGVLLERKARGFALHYRLAPDAGPAVEAAVTSWVALVADKFQALPAHMAWEVRPRGADKGSAVAAIMALPAFSGRLPVFIGDDVTDEDGMVVARQMGGAGLFVPRVFGTPDGVRIWLDRCRSDWGTLPVPSPSPVLHGRGPG